MNFKYSYNTFVSYYIDTIQKINCKTLTYTAPLRFQTSGKNLENYAAFSI
jgi:hypothetical protein